MVGFALGVTIAIIAELSEKASTKEKSRLQKFLEENVDKKIGYKGRIVLLNLCCIASAITVGTVLSFFFFTSSFRHIHMCIFDTVVAVFTEPLMSQVFYTAAEDLGGVDAMYWTVATFTTVGYGDIELSDNPGQRDVLHLLLLIFQKRRRGRFVVTLMFS